MSQRNQIINYIAVTIHFPNLASMKNKLMVSLLMTLTLSIFISCQPSKNSQITSNEILSHISYLASDSLKGRYPGTDESFLAAQYISNQLTEYGLTPFFDNTFQTFDIVTECTLEGENYLIINGDSLNIETDFMPLAFSVSGEKKGYVCFAGYGFDLNTDSLTWNDYADLEVDGKWVLLLREDPEPDNMNSEFIPFAGDRAKVTLAKDKGAIGVLLVNGLNTSKKDIPVPLSYDQNLSDAGIPVISITRAVANQLLTSSIEKLESVMILNKKPLTEKIEATIEAKVQITHKKATGRNVVCMIPSFETSDQFIVIGAHYDHLGMGGSGVSSRMPDTIAVHNGADDNASGIAGMIEMAGYAKAHQKKLKKNLLFVAFDAEEMGLLGSKYFVENWSKDKKITTMLNFDMIGRMKHDTIGISIGGSGTAAQFDSLINNQTVSFKITTSPDGYGPSDHAPFYSEEIPVLYFSTGAHSDYHTPFDDVDAIKPDKEELIVKYATELMLNLAVNSDTLTFQSTGGPQKSRRTRLKVTLGIVPDFSGVIQNGLGIDGVRPDGPADKGGLQKGDIITSINGEEVTNIYDYMFRLSKLKSGTTAIIEINRSNQKEVKLIQL